MFCIHGLAAPGFESDLRKGISSMAEVAGFAIGSDVSGKVAA